MKTLSQSPLSDLLSWGMQELKALGPLEARVNAERLLEEITGLARHEIYSGETDETTDRKFRRLVGQRKKRIPLAYLVGKAYFWNETLEVEPGCLIPRPETETLVERFIEKSGFPANGQFQFLDSGCGSGAIGIALLRHFPNAEAVFCDISEKALEVTRRNLKRYGLSTRAQVVKSDLFENLTGPGPIEKNRMGPGPVSAKWDAILSNPPYLGASDWKVLEPEILFEPREALDGGNDGLGFYRRIAREAGPFLRREGRLVLEAGIFQAEKISDLLSQTKLFREIQIFKDSIGIDRVVMARLGS